MVRLRDGSGRYTRRIRVQVYHQSEVNVRLSRPMRGGQRIDPTNDAFQRGCLGFGNQVGLVDENHIGTGDLSEVNRNEFRTDAPNPGDRT